MKRIIFILVIILAASVSLQAQVSTAQVTGHVYDENKAPLPGVTIVLFNPATNRTTGTMTNERGLYNLVGIQPGRYQLSATFIGYHKTTSNIQLTVGQNAVVDFNMVPSSVQLAQVDVVSNAPKFELSKSDISTTVRAEQIMQLPAESRNVLNLAGLSPGVKSYSPVGGQTLPSAGAVSS
ncbi:MAG: carboxypeptidase-like regulatory domain-containing protein [Bacteroidota bacterium]|nr:carboxypeptidase regulatory-like domain-containing protein [Ignavibacteria bacterium]MCU7499180.1 carboxypeptidase regulatory-like domain-containing protein [Ignavibacteria bacterium]MCU7512927.1 carboxypeptidase regulatory-like domain-containing protein [Ignavibacteria bacterium]MCU7521465.1 carboxypeptidase regulatory-like domain-containing protein [Ignavibacteria bacterium]MCU7526208.1 carboxypeptidase regulatory-like domain-containing protein [Ignavibacteria bacterium]